MTNSWKALIERDVLAGEDYLLVQHTDLTGQRMVVAPLTLIPHKPGFVCSPTMSGEACDLKELLQAFLDAAWAKGLRPRDFEGPQELKAVTRHLDDMRAIAFASIGIDKK